MQCLRFLWGVRYMTHPSHWPSTREMRTPARKCVLTGPFFGALGKCVLTGPFSGLRIARGDDQSSWPNRINVGVAFGCIRVFQMSRRFLGGAFLLVSCWFHLAHLFVEQKQNKKQKRNATAGHWAPQPWASLQAGAWPNSKWAARFFSFLRRTTPVVAFQKADQKGKADETLQESNSNKDALTRVAPFGVPSTSGNHGYSLWRFRENSALVHSPFGVVQKKCTSINHHGLFSTDTG